MKQLTLLFLTLALLTACAAPAAPTVSPTAAPTAAPTTVPVETPTPVPTSAPATPPTEPVPEPTEERTLLKLRCYHEDTDAESYLRRAAETSEVAADLDATQLPETALKTYEGDAFLEELWVYFRDTLGITLDHRWKFYIHYFNQEQPEGLVAITYWMADTISTNRAITLPIQENRICTVFCSYLDRQVDEEKYLQKLAAFLETHEQERANVLGEAFEICGEATNYTYNYRTDELIYTYQIYYLHLETEVINNEWATEVVIP